MCAVSEYIISLHVVGGWWMRYVRRHHCRIKREPLLFFGRTISKDTTFGDERRRYSNEQITTVTTTNTQQQKTQIHPFFATPFFTKSKILSVINVIPHAPCALYCLPNKQTIQMCKGTQMKRSGWCVDWICL